MTLLAPFDAPYRNTPEYIFYPEKFEKQIRKDRGLPPLPNYHVEQYESDGYFVKNDKKVRKIDPHEFTGPILTLCLLFFLIMAIIIIVGVILL